MPEATTRAITIADIFDSPTFAELCDEYRAESLRNDDLAGPEPDRAAYEHLESSGLIRPIGLFVGDLLVGWCIVLVTPVLHFAGKMIASTETLFISKAHRAGGTGRMLIKAAEEVAASVGVSGLYISAPSGGRLARLLPHLDYRETNILFYRGLQ